MTGFKTAPHTHKYRVRKFWFQKFFLVLAPMPLIALGYLYFFQYERSSHKHAQVDIPKASLHPHFITNDTPTEDDTFDFTSEKITHKVYSASDQVRGARTKHSQAKRNFPIKVSLLHTNAHDNASSLPQVGETFVYDTLLEQFDKADSFVVEEILPENTEEFDEFSAKVAAETQKMKQVMSHDEAVEFARLQSIDFLAQPTIEFYRFSSKSRPVPHLPGQFISIDSASIKLKLRIFSVRDNRSYAFMSSHHYGPKERRGGRISKLSHSELELLVSNAVKKLAMKAQASLGPAKIVSVKNNKVVIAKGIKGQVEEGDLYDVMQYVSLPSGDKIPEMVGRIKIDRVFSKYSSGRIDEQQEGLKIKAGDMAL